MINLIPPVAKKIIAREYYLRVASVWMMLLGTAALVTVLLLLPTYILIDLKTAVLQEQAVAATDKISSYDLSATEIQTANVQAQILTQKVDSLVFTDTIAEFETLSGPMVAINEYRFLMEGANQSITLSGIAETRESLANFRDKLALDPAYHKVDLPIENLIKDKDLLFSMTITLASSTPTT